MRTQPTVVFRQEGYNAIKPPIKVLACRPSGRIVNGGRHNLWSQRSNWSFLGIGKELYGSSLGMLSLLKFAAEAERLNDTQILASDLD